MPGSEACRRSQVSDEVMAQAHLDGDAAGPGGGGSRTSTSNSERLDTRGCVAVLHEVRDPGNAGTVLRSADAAGAAGVVFSSLVGGRVQPQDCPRLRRVAVPPAARARRADHRDPRVDAFRRGAPCSRWPPTGDRTSTRRICSGPLRSSSATRRRACPRRCSSRPTPCARPARRLRGVAQPGRGRGGVPVRVGAAPRAGPADGARDGRWRPPPTTSVRR